MIENFLPKIGIFLQIKTFLISMNLKKKFFYAIFGQGHEKS